MMNFDIVNTVTTYSIPFQLVWKTTIIDSIFCVLFIQTFSKHYRCTDCNNFVTINLELTFKHLTVLSGVSVSLQFLHFLRQRSLEKSDFICKEQRAGTRSRVIDGVLWRIRPSDHGEKSTQAILLGRLPISDDSIPSISIPGTLHCWRRYYST